MAGKILVGTASWADPEFIRSWYPKGLRRDQLLPYYSQFFNMVEYNGSFYSIPAPRQVERWTHLTPQDFTFNVKLFKLLSRHACDLKALPVPLQRIAETNDRGRVML